MSPYEILGVSHDANFGTVKKAYHKLCLEYHPDRIADPAHREIGQEKFKEIQNAYEILIDASKRAELD
ncbi:heat shock protein DnaJ, partial [Lophium mytilinum]